MQQVNDLHARLLAAHFYLVAEDHAVTHGCITRVGTSNTFAFAHVDHTYLFTDDQHINFLASMNVFIIDALYGP